MEGEAGRVHVRGDGVQEALLAGPAFNRTELGGGLYTGPRFVEQDGAALVGYPDIIEAQRGG